MKIKERIRFAVLSNLVIGKYFIKKDLDYLLSFSFKYDGTMRHVIEKSFKTFLTKEEYQDEKLKEELTLDIVQCYYRYLAHPKEYFLFGFKGYSHKRRAEFLTNRHKDAVMKAKIGLGKNRQLLENKGLFYEKFKDFFFRDVCIVTDNGCYQAFLAFVDNHKSFIAKPLNGQCGVGVEICTADSDSVRHTLFDKFVQMGGVIIEELIVQDRRMAEWNESSVNTIRLPAFMTKKGFKILKPFFRMGRRGSIVDNAATGGIFAIIDESTGFLSTDGYDENGGKYFMHPDCGKVIKGWQVPQWEELLQLAKKVHNKIPYYTYVGWDFALSDRGWMLIEGNWGQFLSEMADREGIKKKFDKMFE